MVYVLTGEIDNERLVLGVFKNQGDAESEKKKLIEKLAESQSAYDVLDIEEFEIK